MAPLPGTATEADVLELLDHENRACELIDGTLVEKPVGAYESELAAILIGVIRDYLRGTKLGKVYAPDAAFRVRPGRVRLPDVMFVHRDRIPTGGLGRPRILDVAPDLAIEILSPSNTAAEMSDKRMDYFSAGVRLVWEIDPFARQARVFTPDGRIVELGAADQLDGGDVLPGFAMRLTDLFAELDDAPTT